jgi:WD40 repeat protein
VEDLALSPDDTRLVAGGETAFGSGVSSVLVWDVEQAEVLLQVPTTGSHVFCVDWSPLGDLVAAGDQSNAIRIHDATDGHLVKTLAAGGPGGCFDLAFSPDGTQLVAGYADHAVRIWDIASGQVVKTLLGHTFFVDSVAYSPDGARIASGGWDNAIRTWNAASGALEHVLLGHTDIVRDLAFSPDGTRLASGSWDHTVRLWNAATGAALPVLSSPDPGAVNALRYAPDGVRLAFGGIGAGGFVASTATGSVLAEVGHHMAPIHHVALSANAELLLTSSSDDAVRVWEVDLGGDLGTFTGHQDVVNAIDLSPDASLAASGSGSPPPLTVDPSVRLWDPGTRAELFLLPGHAGGTTAVEFDADGTAVVSGGRDGAIKTWSTASGALQKTFSSAVGTVTDLELSPAGNRLAVCGSGLRILDAASGAVLKTLSVPGGNPVAALAFSPDGTRLLAGVSSYGDNLHLFDAVSGALLRTFTGDPDGFVQGVAFSPDGRTVACGSGYSRTIRTFAVEDGKALKTWDKETGWGPFPQLPLVYAPDGGLAYGRTDATVVLSDCPGAFEGYGVGCAGAGGYVPALGGSGCATAGGTVTFEVSDGAGGALAFLVVGSSQASLPIFGCTLLVAPLLIPPVAMPLSDVGAGPGSGIAELSVPLSSGMPSVTLALQAGIFDPGAPSGWAATNGVLMTIE